MTENDLSHPEPLQGKCRGSDKEIPSDLYLWHKEHNKLESCSFSFEEHDFKNKWDYETRKLSLKEKLTLRSSYPIPFFQRFYPGDRKDDLSHPEPHIKKRLKEAF